LTKLPILILSNNKFTTLPKEIGNLTNLTMLGLGNNQLTILPKEIGNLQKLSYLDLSNNKLTDLPVKIRKKSDLSIEVDNNPLPDIENFWRWTKTKQTNNSKDYIHYLNGKNTIRRTDKYDDQEHLIEQAYFGVDGQPVLFKDGYAKVTYKYDEQGNWIEKAYWGIDEKPTLVDGYAKITWKHDEQGNAIEKAYWGIDEKPTLVDGYAKATGKYNKYGHPVAFAYYDADGKLCADDRGVKKRTMIRDKEGKVIAGIVLLNRFPYFDFVTMNTKYTILFLTILTVAGIIGGFLLRRKKIIKWFCWGLAGLSLIGLIVYLWLSL
jgi:hypothetical protein